MFDLTVKTADIILSVQTLAIIMGFYFSVRTLKDAKSSIGIASDNLKTATDSFKEATANDQAQLYSQIAVQGRELVYKHMDIFHSSGNDADIKERQKLYTGSVLSYYAVCYGLRSILPLPASVTKLLDAELKELMREAFVRQRYEELKAGYSKEFNQYVTDNTGV